MRRALALMVVAGCRLHFDPLTTDDAPADGAADAFDVCAQPSTILCEGFTTAPSAPLLGDVQWLATGGRSGGGLQARGTQASQGVAMWAVPPITDGPIDARVWLRIEPGAPIQTFLVTLQLDNALSTGGQEKFSVDISQGERWTIGAPYSGTGGAGITAAMRDRWYCVELRVMVSSTAGEVHLLVDDSEVTAFTMRDTLLPMGVRALWLASFISSTDPDTTVDYDDLVIATEPIGCSGS